MTKQPEIRYRFLDVWLEPSENPKGHLSWNSGDIHSVLFAWSRLCLHPGNNDRGFLRGYSQRIFSMSTFEAIMHIEDSKENQEDKRLSQGIEFL